MIITKRDQKSPTNKSNDKESNKLRNEKNKH